VAGLDILQDKFCTDGRGAEMKLGDGGLILWGYILKIASHFVPLTSFRDLRRDLRQQILIYKTSRDCRFCRMSRPATFS